jgi:hypothetical protein
MQVAMSPWWWGYWFAEADASGYAIVANHSWSPSAMIQLVSADGLKAWNETVDWSGFKISPGYPKGKDWNDGLIALVHHLHPPKPQRFSSLGSVKNDIHTIILETYFFGHIAPAA